MAYSNATQIEGSDNSYINNDLKNGRLTTTMNTAKEVPCAKYLHSTSSSRPKSQGIMGSQRLGKKTIAHTDQAHYEMYMKHYQSKQYQDPEVKVYGGDTPKRDPSEEEPKVTHVIKPNADLKHTFKLPISSPKSRVSTVDAKGNSCLFKHVSKQMQAAFSQQDSRKSKLPYGSTIAT